MDKNELIQFLKDNLSLGKARGCFTDPNRREIELKLCDEVISSVSFDVVQMRENMKAK